MPIQSVAEVHRWPGLGRAEPHVDAGDREPDSLTVATADADPRPTPQGTDVGAVGQELGGPFLRLGERDQFIEVRRVVVFHVALRATRGIPRVDLALLLRHHFWRPGGRSPRPHKPLHDSAREQAWPRRLPWGRLGYEASEAEGGLRGVCESSASDLTISGRSHAGSELGFIKKVRAGLPGVLRNQIGTHRGPWGTTCASESIVF